jgi:hypothetical protein
MKKVLRYFQRASCAKARFHPIDEEDFFIIQPEWDRRSYRPCGFVSGPQWWTQLSHLRLAMTPSLPVCGI